MRAATGLALLALLPTALLTAHCSSSVTCGTGTTLDKNQCVASATPGGSSGGSSDGGVESGSQPISGPKAAKFGGATSVSPASKSALLVTWDPAEDTFTATNRMRYRIYVGTQAGQFNFSAPTATTPPGASSHLITGLTEGTDYFVVVRSVNESDLEDENTAEKGGKPQSDATAPTFGGAKAAESASGSAVLLSWDGATDDLTAAQGTSYVVYWSESSGGQNLFAPSLVTAPGATSVVVNGLPKPNTKYYFVVRAQDAAGNLDTNAKEVSAESGADATPPLFSGCASVVPKDAASVTVTWNAGFDDSTPASQLAYDVFASSTAGQQDFTTPTATFATGTSGVVAGLQPSTTYYFVCRARDASGNADQNRAERVATTLSDGTPPTFAGAAGISNVSATQVDLNWAAATDDKTAQGEIVYDVFEASTSGGHDFNASPKATSAAGATSITLTNLTPASTLYWVVRARDKAGNRDANVVQKNASTGVSFGLNVQPIFDQHCAVTGCHVAGHPLGLNLAPGFAYPLLYNVVAASNGAYKRVKPSDAANSFIHMKIQGTAGIGEIMPPPSTGDSLSAGEKALIQNWINQGALNN